MKIMLHEEEMNIGPGEFWQDYSLLLPDRAVSNSPVDNSK